MKAVGETTGKVAFYSTCYGNYNTPHLGEDFAAVFRHNGIHIDLVPKEACCGMPKLELGDLDAVNELKEKNIPVLAKRVDEGYDLIAPIPSCVLMFKQELPLMFPDNEQVLAVAKAFYDPFEYLHKLHKEGRLSLDFKQSLGNVSYHVACHQRVYNIGPKTKLVLELNQDTMVKNIERCSGHDGTYGVKSETLEFANKIARPIVTQIEKQEPDHYGSDCPVAGKHIENNLKNKAKDSQDAIPPIDLLCLAYGI